MGTCQKTLSCQYLKMKAIFVFSLVVALTNGWRLRDEPEACATCRAGTGALLASGLTDDSLLNQEDILIDQVCSQAEDELGCVIGVLDWWEQIAKIIFDADAASYVCHNLNEACEATFQSKAWDCDTCKADPPSQTARLRPRGSSDCSSWYHC